MRPPGKPRPDAVLAQEARLAAAVGLGGGGVVGLVLALLLLGSEHVELALPAADARSAVALLFPAVGGCLAAVALLPLALVRWWRARAASRRRRRSSTVGFYAWTLAVGAGLAHVLLYLAFRVERDLASLRAQLLVLAVIGVALGVWRLGLVGVARWGREQRKCLGRGVEVALVLALAVAVGSGVVLARTSAGVSSGLSAPAGQSGPASGPARGVVLVSIDTLRPDHLGVYGSRRDTSPHLDRLATDGAWFRRARAQAPWTLPSHATLFTGLYPVSHGVRFFQNSMLLGGGAADSLDPSRVTLAELAAAAGLRTAGFASNVFVSGRFGLDQGFQHFVLEPTRDAGRVIDGALRWLEAEPGRPFFLFVHLMNVHDYQAPESFLARYVDPFYSGAVATRPFVRSKIVGNLYRWLDPADLAYLEARYDGALRYVDGELGRLFSWLREVGAYDSSLVIVTSDHGEEFFEHGGTGHGFTLYEEQLAVPLIVKPPRRLPGHGVVVAGPVAALIDIAPTVVDYLGLSDPPYFEGRSLRPVLEGGSWAARPLFAESTVHFNSYAVVEGDLKLIGHRFPPATLLRPRFLLASVRAFYKWRPDELFELDRDPLEQSSVIARRPAAVRRLKVALAAHLEGAASAASLPLDSDTVKRLRALGYLN